LPLHSPIGLFRSTLFNLCILLNQTPRSLQFRKSGALIKYPLKLQVGEDADRQFDRGVDHATIDHMTTDDLALGIGDAHVEMNAIEADRACKGEDFVFAINRGVGILARKSQGYGVEATDAAEDDSGGDVFCVRDRLESLAQVYIGGQTESQGFEGAAGCHVLYFGAFYKSCGRTLKV
jgi:hypothetical protein